MGAFENPESFEDRTAGDRARVAGEELEALLREYADDDESLLRAFDYLDSNDPVMALTVFEECVERWEDGDAKDAVSEQIFSLKDSLGIEE